MGEVVDLASYRRRRRQRKAAARAREIGLRKEPGEPLPAKKDSSAGKVDDSDITHRDEKSD